MTIEKQQHDENEKNMPLAVVDKAAFGESRRRFTKAGIAASGVLVTLASRPALGCTVGVSPSVYCSGNVSGHGTSNTSNPGCPPYVWSGNCDSGWPGKFKGKQNQTFGACFQTSNSGTFGKLYGKTLKQVLDGSPDDKQSCGRYLVTALFNNVSGKAPFLTESTIRDMCSKLHTNNAWVPNRGATAWGVTQVVNYLAGTWD